MLVSDTMLWTSQQILKLWLFVECISEIVECIQKEYNAFKSCVMHSEILEYIQNLWNVFKICGTRSELLCYLFRICGFVVRAQNLCKILATYSKLVERCSKLVEGFTTSWEIYIWIWARASNLSSWARFSLVSENRFEFWANIF